jgi:hypothetical protein
LDDALFQFVQHILIGCALSGSAVALGLQLTAHLPISYLLLFLLLFASFALAGIYVFWRAFRQFRQAQHIRLGLRGEQAVAEALSEVADCGFRAFHDLPGGENWNIDHVAVCSRGVFLIETKARRKRINQTGQPEHKVFYDGDTLRFPAGTDRKAVAQTQRNAQWLSEFLKKRCGEPVTVTPVLVLPGWYVETTKGGPFCVKVMNASYLCKFLRAQNSNIEAAQTRRIIAALDEKCRDVEF